MQDFGSAGTPEEALNQNQRQFIAKLKGKPLLLIGERIFQKIDPFTLVLQPADVLQSGERSPKSERVDGHRESGCGKN